MAHTLTVNLNSGKTLTLKQIANVKVITDDAVINTTARNFFNIGQADKYVITSDCGHTALKRHEVSSVSLNEDDKLI
ncbi:hypothetical protein AYR54_04840 [Loigolactobacillus backii]|uniref:hypothetical protein n=1 Tax=Loigolactobacillus backii TaxID=375175 RepID=UPI0007F05A98|nr:hypothetical protein [Loigolactobacillus backii]ANK59634.1 hypothetical protein AYR52_04825 [Loigolactobacillus backii]ANK64628.1 hypothetical protein AYR54_04840 [Loigolactobacillus backii]ANK66976.1 hypothetical protein AYR55_04200 [Loigolactobacillus backii]OLF68379.1 hypothetical protein ACX53_11850 [Loigolactobacillus backii]PIO87625.1 hypothetical protein B8A32_10985 [Loigolactobacillus backii]